MKITQLETLCLSRMHEPERQWFTARYRIVKADCVVVLISTGEGIIGGGEASAYGVSSSSVRFFALRAKKNNN